MTQLFKFLFLLVFAIGYMSCGNDTNAREAATETANKEVAELKAPPHEAEGHVAFRSGNNLTLTNGEVMKLPPGSDTSVVTIFVVRHAEKDSVKSGISLIGQARAARLAELFQSAAIEQIYVDSNPSMQTGLMTSKSNSCDLGTFKPEVLENTLKILTHSYKGKKAMIVGTKETAARAVNMLAGKIYTSKIADDEYDNIYVAIVKNLGDAEIHHFKF
ncbi:MAG: hypothetical protein H6577_20135 [Lewinellaceae bacterium]|nr:hypothetical protein [Saprospiraceae bacterium]MCB9340439.1 hypothetical protein [Lewinellaceae bacterium]